MASVHNPDADADRHAGGGRSHEHQFEENDAGTLIRDRVHYIVRGRIFEPALHRFFVRPEVERIFRYRTSRLERLFGVVKLSESVPWSFAAAPD